MKYIQLNQDGLGIEHFTPDELERFVNEICEEFAPDYSGIKKINSKKYEFSVKNMNYVVDITESITLDTNRKLVEIKFKLINNPNIPKKDDFQSDSQYQIALQKSQIGVTGTGNGIQVFKKVIATFIETIKEIKPDYVGFTADESNRQQLYNKITTTIQKYIPFKYKQLKNHPTDGYELNTNEFWLEIEYN